MIDHTETDYQDMKKRKDVAYWERQQMVAALSHVWPSFLTKHPDSDKKWQDDWRTIVVVILPHYGHGRSKEDGCQRYTIPGCKREWGKQITWHIHDFDVPLFDHLQWIPNLEGNNGGHSMKIDQWERDIMAGNFFNWDGHTTEEKYRRLRDFFREIPKSLWERGADESQDNLDR